MFLDPNDSLRLSLWGEYEPFETRLFTSHIQSGHVVLDIGANIGYYTLLAARLVGPQGAVYAFEPDPDNFALLQKNIHRNGYRNVVLKNQAVADENGKIELFKGGENWGGHRIYDPGDSQEHITVDAIVLDDFFKGETTDIDLIKMDIEGAEVRAIQGMSTLLEKSANIKLFTEFSPAALSQSGSSPEEYLELLVQFGFALHFLDEERATIQAASAGDILKFTAGQEAPANLFCTKGADLPQRNQ